MSQSDRYKYIERTDYLADLVGADVAADVIKTVIETVEDQVDVEDRPTRDLGKVDIAEADTTIGVEQETPISLEDSGGTQIDPATNTSLTSTLSREIATWTAGTLDVEQQTPVGVEDSGGTQIDPFVSTDADQVSDSTSASGSANAASVDLGDVRESIDVFYDVAADTDGIVLEVSTDNATWRELTRVAASDLPAGGEAAFIQAETAYQYARAYAGGSFADADVNAVEIVTRGI